MHDEALESDRDEPVPIRDPLVLIADPLAGPTTWDRVAPLLDGGFEVLRESVDGPSVTPEDPSLAVDRWWAEEMVRRDLYPAHLVADGFAAISGLRLARRRPELVRSLVLVTPIVRFLDPPRPTGARWSEVESAFTPVAAALARHDAVLARELRRAAMDPAGPVSPRLGASGVPPDRGQRAWAAGWAAGDAWTVEPPEEIDFLPPVLVVDGDRSPLFARAIADELAGRFPNATRLTLPDAGALLAEDDPRRIAALLFSFCRERNVPGA